MMHMKVHDLLTVKMMLQHNIAMAEHGHQNAFKERQTYVGILGALVSAQCQSCCYTQCWFSLLFQHLFAECKGFEIADVEGSNRQTKQHWHTRLSQAFQAFNGAYLLRDV